MRGDCNPKGKILFRQTKKKKVLVIRKIWNYVNAYNNHSISIFIQACTYKTVESWCEWIYVGCEFVHLIWLLSFNNVALHCYFFSSSSVFHSIAPHTLGRHHLSLVSNILLYRCFIKFMFIHEFPFCFFCVGSCITIMQLFVIQRKMLVKWTE